MHAIYDGVGYLAAFLLVMTFFMKNMKHLRCVALSSSLAWLVYGFAGTLLPIIILHCMLIPINSFRLYQDVYRNA